MSTPIPVSNPSLGEAERMAVARCLDSGFVTQGRLVAEFEERFAAFLGTPHAAACASGTAALHLALLALGVKPGDEVLVPDLTFVATANAVAYIGARPVLVDVEPDTWNIDLADAERKITARTTAIIPVHLYGRACRMTDVMNLAARYRLWVIEDAAQGLGGEFAGSPLGTIGHAGTFSFYANKVITTVEGGAVVSRFSDVIDRVKLLRGQGQGSRRYFHEVIGFNYRMTDLHAAIGLAQLDRINDFLAARRAIFALYHECLRLPARQPAWLPTSAPWLFTVALPAGVSPDVVASELLVRGIETRPVFVPIHQLPAHHWPEGRFPVAEGASQSGLSLPTYVGVYGHVRRIAAAVQEIVDGIRSSQAE